MKHYSLLFVACLAVLLSSASFALVPVPDGQITLPMQQGFYADGPAWFICTDTNDIKTAVDQKLTLAPRLSSAATSVAFVYIAVNAPHTQGPVFSTIPGNADYSGKWQVIYICFKPGFTRQISNSLISSPTNPYGIPPAAQAVFTFTNIIVDYPIMALGQLGGPWKSVGGNVIYRIPEGISATLNPITITLPTYNVFCSDPLTKQPMTARTIITDVSNAALATRLGANFAPALTFIPFHDRQTSWIFGSPLDANTSPPGQFPVIQACPKPVGPKNSNFDYTPVMELVQLAGLNPCPPSVIPVSVRIFTPDTVQFLLGKGLLTPLTDWGPINSSVVGSL